MPSQPAQSRSSLRWHRRTQAPILRKGGRTLKVCGRSPSRFHPCHQGSFCCRCAAALPPAHFIGGKGSARVDLVREPLGYETLQHSVEMLKSADLSPLTIGYTCACVRLHACRLNGRPRVKHDCTRTCARIHAGTRVELRR